MSRVESPLSHFQVEIRLLADAGHSRGRVIAARGERIIELLALPVEHGRVAARHVVVFFLMLGLLVQGFRIVHELLVLARFNELGALFGLSLSIRPGENCFLGLFHPNGFLHSRDVALLDAVDRLAVADVVLSG